MRICMIGAGAMGAIYGGLLAKSGADLVFIDPWEDNVRALRRDGLKLSGITGDMVIPVVATTDVGDVGVVDVAIVQLSTYATAHAAEIAAATLRPEGYCVTLQNGVGNIETLSAVLGRERVAGGLSYHSGAMEGPGRVAHTHAGPTWLGELDGTLSDRLVKLAETLERAGFTPTVVDNIEELIWVKFLHNVAINAPSAFARLRVGELSLYPPADELQTKIIEEALKVMEAKGIEIPEEDPMADIKAFCRAKFNKASMTQHVEAARRTEIDSLNGIIVEEGRKLGIPTPFNEALTLIIRTIDARNAYHAVGPVDFDRLEKERNAEVAAGQ